MNEKLFSKILIISFGVFGLTALIYQVAFAKNLVLLFGLTAPAIATVLAVYFSGLALGSFIFGKLVDRPTSKIKLYTKLFIGVGVYGFFVPFFFQVLGKIIKLINQTYPLNFSGFNFFAFLLSFLFLIVPAVLIGGSFPVISKIIIRESQTLGKKISLLYFINTFGSVLGALLAGFWLIPAIGVKITLFSASGLNLATAGLLIFCLKSTGDTYGFLREEGENTRVNQHNSQSSSRQNKASGSEQEPAALQNNLFVFALFLTGFLALALEVFYAKTLVLFLGSSTYAFSLVLIVFLLGIALGSLTISRFLDQIKKGFFFFGLFLGLLGFWLFITLNLFEEFPFTYLQVFQLFKFSNFATMILSQSLLLAFIIFPATFLTGMIFLLGIKLASPSLEKIGQGIGKLYFANTLGGVMGSLAAGFFLLPRFGFQKSLVFILAIYILLAVFFVLKEKGLNIIFKNTALVFLIGIFLFSVFSPPWSKENLSMGIFFDLPNYLGQSKEEIKADWQKKEILFYKEGLSQVMVVKRDEDLWLSVNGKIDASNRTDLETEILSGALPLILHKNPKEVLVIGLGSGITLGAVTRLENVEKIEAVEIDPAVIDAAKYFKDYNHNALADPRVKIILADARNHLLLDDKKYDVISSTPSNPWVSGNSYLFTKEFYQLCQSRLKEDGLMLQWIQYYSFSPKDLKAVLATFQETFSKTYLFGSLSTFDLFLVGANSEDSILDFERIEKKLKEEKIQKELARIHINNSHELLARFIASDLAVKEMAKGAEIHKDDRPFIEFSAPKYIYEKTNVLNLEILAGLRGREKSLPKFFLNKETEKTFKAFSFMENWIFSQIYILKEEWEEALFFTEKAYQAEINDFQIFYNLKNLYLQKAETLKEQGETEEAEKFFKQAETVIF